MTERELIREKRAEQGPWSNGKQNNKVMPMLPNLPCNAGFVLAE